MEEYSTIPKLARMLGVSDNTVRRYITNYPQFFETKIIDGNNQYPAEKTLEVLKCIKDNSASGKRKSEVLPILLESFEVIEDQEPEEESAGLKGGVFEFGPETLALIRSIDASLKKIAEGQAV